LYGDGTIVADNITTNTYTLANMPAPAQSYTVTATHGTLTESDHSNAVVLGPSVILPPTGLTGVWNNAPTFTVDLSWNYLSQPGDNTVLLDETFTTTPFTRGWLSLQGAGAQPASAWAWVNSTTNVPVPRPPCVASYTWNNNAFTPDNWLVTPEITGLNGVTKLSWLVSPQEVGFTAEKYSVYVSTTGNQIANFTAAPLFTEICTDDMFGGVFRTVDLTEFAGQSVWIAFRHYDCTDEYRLLIDDI
jgi:hypothetical protein